MDTMKINGNKVVVEYSIECNHYGCGKFYKSWKAYLKHMCTEHIENGTDIPFIEILAVTSERI